MLIVIKSFPYNEDTLLIKTDLRPKVSMYVEFRDPGLTLHLVDTWADSDCIQQLILTASLIQSLPRA